MSAAPLSAQALRSQAEALVAGLPPLRLAAPAARAGHTGAHGQRRAGPGAEFWQYRPAQSHEARAIDWRRSARSDAHYVQDREAQRPRVLELWVSDAPSMAYGRAPRKGDRAALLALCVGLLALRAGDQVGVLGAVPPGAGPAQPDRVARALVAGGALDMTGLTPGAQMLGFGDFLGDLEPLRAALRQAQATGATGALMQVLDPAEVQFPFDGAVQFQDLSGRALFDTQSAADLRSAYLERLAAQQDALHAAAQSVGWPVAQHLTDAAPGAALNWLCAVSGGAA